MNASGTCYHTGAGSYPDYGCNHYPNCNWAGHASNYHLTAAQLEADVVKSMDWDLHEAPVNPNFTKALKLLNKTWGRNSVRATKDPFARVNKPWKTNISDFVANGDEAQKVKQCAHK